MTKTNRQECVIVDFKPSDVFHDIVIGDYVPTPYRRSREVKGVYLFLQRNIGVDDWEDQVRNFCKEKLGTTYEGKGSVRRACVLIQKNWATFVKYIKNKNKKITPLERGRTG